MTNSLFAIYWKARVRGMNVKYAQLKKALEQIGYKGGLGDKPNTVLEVTYREEDVGKGVLGECLIIKCSTTKGPDKYDDWREQTSEWTVEVYAEHENREPRLILNQTTTLNTTK